MSAEDNAIILIDGNIRILRNWNLIEATLFAHPDIPIIKVNLHKRKGFGDVLIWLKDQSFNCSIRLEHSSICLYLETEEDYMAFKLTFPELCQ